MRKPFHVLRIGSDTLVSVSRAGVHAFRRTWPGSTLPDRAVWFRFERNGDLVDTNCRTDGSDVVALSHDAWQAAQEVLSMANEMVSSANDLKGAPHA